MLRSYCVLTLALLGVGLTVAQSADPVLSDADQLKASLVNWEQAREECGGDYSYQVRWSSAFGFGHTTTITVQGNKVVERKYVEFGQPEPVKPGEAPAEPKPKWVEMGKELGTHKEGTAGRTMDELYAEAKKLLEKDLPGHERRSLAFDQQGLLNYCFTRDTRIADDSPLSGIAAFQLQLKAKQ